MQQDSMISTRTMKQVQSQPQISADIFNPPPYSSIFFHSSPSPATFTAPSSSSDAKSTRISAEAVKKLSLIMSDYKELLNRYAISLNQLRKTFNESETLRQENTNLRLANAKLSNQVDLLIQATLENQKLYQTPSPSRFPVSFRGVLEKDREFEGTSRSPMSLGDSKSPLENEKEDENEDEDDDEDDDRVTLPKSISVRSNGYLKFEDSSSTLRPATRVRASTPVNAPKKVYVRGGGKKDGPIELEVYNQGMFKTELCNKWQETGSCPYGEHCQFAHGIDELRPVIRHPRYKTEVCRMVLSGEPCPYGHRCHFRHALTDQEKLMLPLNLE